MDDDSASISGHLSLTGTEFSNMSPADQADAVARLNVFSRVEPSHKSLLVDRLREQVSPFTTCAPFKYSACFLPAFGVRHVCRHWFVPFQSC